jgi:hypothetical protein
MLSFWAQGDLEVPEFCWYYMVVIPHQEATEADEVEVRVVGGQAIAQVRC